MANGKSFQGVPLREVAVVAHAVSAALAGNRVTSDLDSALQTLLPGCLSVRYLDEPASKQADKTQGPAMPCLFLIFDRRASLV